MHIATMPSFFDPVLLEGRYARLVPLSLDHAAPLLAAANASRATFQFTVVPADLEGARRYVAQALELQKKHAALPFAIVEKGSGAVVGTTRYLNVEHWDYPEASPLARPSDAPHVVEIGGTWLGEAFQRTGLNTDAKLLLLTHAFETWRVLRVSLKTDARNTKSRANIERVGARFDGILRAHMPASDGGVRDTAFYSILESEWPDVKARLAAKLR